MLSIIVSFVAGLLLALLGFWICGGGIPGIIVAVILAAAGYVGVSFLTQPERKLGQVLASAIPNGQKAVEAIDAANANLSTIGGLRSQVRDQLVGKEVDDFAVATRALVQFVESNPQSYDTLRHYVNVYGVQTEKLLRGYVEVEQSGATDQIAKARSETIEALQVLEQTAAGELSRAVESKTLALSADSDAIVRLASLDGYTQNSQNDMDAVGNSGAGGAGSANNGFAGNGNAQGGNR
ncbi:hypothetical protein BTIS_0263 [Bifidobacterium tissieri]|uniref:5-bromo-4-chloroindolyl phosphate hydrolysis protein n=1 Tax=Bifidobacterium tissieri TaxID=1630162 RepID=A0A261FIX2_9BIFI|nr:MULTISPECIES: 5-bromo-4-chloroindolyl phosphate hydrolysis family protein [Bifidobacterium]OZG59110.1 hypothetical protein BTIS_0263 [Bifidobacterium tissieri]TPF96018.1 hypothetical protein EP30_09870 [Bifidobacterium sp. UTCIF-39]